MQIAHTSLHIWHQVFMLSRCFVARFSASELSRKCVVGWVLLLRGASWRSLSLSLFFSSFLSGCIRRKERERERRERASFSLRGLLFPSRGEKEKRKERAPAYCLCVPYRVCTNTKSVYVQSLGALLCSFIVNLEEFFTLPPLFF